MFDVELDQRYIVTQEGTSEGTQVKYYRDGYWYKLDNRGNEGLSEYLVSHFLEFTSLSENEFVLYEQGFINGKSGCRSRNFLNSGEELVTLYRLYMNEYGKDLSEVVSQMPTMEERIKYVVGFVQASCNIDITPYFKKMFTLDAIVLNEDRHFNNIALVETDYGFTPAPIFDNGVSLLTANVSVNMNFPLEENVKRTIAKPFSGSFTAMRDYFGVGIEVDVASAIDWINAEPNSYEKDVLEFQLKHSINSK